MNLWILVTSARARKQRSAAYNSKVTFRWVHIHSCASSAVGSSYQPNFRPTNRAITKVVRELMLPPK